MKKMYVILGLIVLTIFIVACAPSGETLSGNAKALPKGVTTPTKETAKQQLGEGKPEICDNNVDDNGDGKIDCADSKCSGWVFRGSYMTSKDNKAFDYICANGKRLSCGGDVSQGTLNVDDKFDALCDIWLHDENGKLITGGRFTECDANNVQEMNYKDNINYLSRHGKGGIKIFELKNHQVSALCTSQTSLLTGKIGEKWLFCGTKVSGPNDSMVLVGTSFEGYHCFKDESSGKTFYKWEKIIPAKK